MPDLNSVSVKFALKTQEYLSKKSDDRTRRITDFVGGVGAGKEFSVVTGVEGDFSVDNVNVLHGKESVKITALANAGKIFSTGTIKTRDFTDYTSGRVWFYVDNKVNLNSVYVYAYTGSDYYLLNIPRFETGWNVYSFNRSEWTISGTPTGWGNVDKFNFRAIASASGTVNVSFDCIEFYNPENTTAIATMSFDDGFTSSYTVVAPALESKGFRGIFFIIPNKVGTAGYMSVSEILDLISRGHEIGAHGYDHTDYSTISMSAIRADIDKTIDWFILNNIPIPKVLALPIATYLDQNREAVVNERFNLVRGATSVSLYETTDAIPFGMPYSLRAVGLSGGASPCITALNLASENRGVCNIYAHDVNEVGGSPASTIADLNLVLDHLYSGDYEVNTFTNLLKKYPRMVW